MPDILGYNPNIDSGIAEARSYVEVSKTTLASLSSYIDLDRDPTKRYFAQIVYNVGPGSSLIDNLTPDEISQIRDLLKFKDSLLSIKTIVLKFVPVGEDNKPTESMEKVGEISIETVGKISIYAYYYKGQTSDGNIAFGDSIGGIIEITTPKEICIPGFVCGVESHELTPDYVNNGPSIISKETYKFLPRMRTVKTSEGRVETYLNLEEEIGHIIEKITDPEKRIVKISYLQQPIIEAPNQLSVPTKTVTDI
jgi:hypothetical protein